MAGGRTDRGVHRGGGKVFLECSHYLLSVSDQNSKHSEKRKKKERRHDPVSINLVKATDKYGFPEWEGQATFVHTQ